MNTVEQDHVTAYVEVEPQLSHFHGSARGRVIIAASGPSLKEHLAFLRATDIPTIGLNRCYKKFTPDFLVCVNKLLLEQFADEIAEVDTVKFIPIDFPGSDKFVNKAGTCIRLDMTGENPSWSPGLFQPIWAGHTVTYVALQLAAYIGFNNVIILGLDHAYPEWGSKPNAKNRMGDIDSGHFYPDYFPPGTKFNNPDLRMAETAFALARANYPGNIYNCSASTLLDVFPILPLQHVLSGEPGSVSALVSAYKCAPFLRECLDDIERQTLWRRGTLEAVVVYQEGSPEEPIVQEWAGQWGESVVLVPTKDVPTVYAAWNMAARAASGEYLTNWNTDDKRRYDACEVMAQMLSGCPEWDLVYADCFITWELGITFDEFHKTYKGKELVLGRRDEEPGIFVWPEYSRDLLSRGCFVGPMPMWRANLHQRFGPFLDRMKSAGDYEFWMRIAGEKNMKHLPLTLGLYAARAEGLELSSIDQSFSETWDAVALHQAKRGASIMPWFNRLVRIGVGDEYAFVKADELPRLADKVSKESMEAGEEDVHGN